MFTEQQLERIKVAAKKRKNQGELAVFKEIFEAKPIPGTPISETVPKFSITQARVIEYCAEQYKRQHSGEMSVYDMVNAWEYATKIFRSVPNHLDTSLIQVIGKLVEPDDNRNGFRTIPMGVTDGMGGWIEKANWEQVPRLLEHLLASYYAGYMTPVRSEDENQDSYAHPLSVTAEDEFYFNFEEIHPFVDGNGRTGKILYNYLLGTLDNPVMPPPNFGEGVIREPYMAL